MIYFWSKIENGVLSGGNNFLSNLRQYLEDQKLYTPHRSAASSILVDSYHNLISGLSYKLRRPHIYFIYRFGPIFHLHRSSAWKLVDKIMITTANYCADLVIFQSNWSLEQARLLGFKATTPYRVIYNGVDTKIFKKESHSLSAKIKLIATSWSSNFNKGFSFLEYLDSHLDWKKYELTFIGNSPLKFKNINQSPPQPRHELATLLQHHDIYISPTKDDACSNALLEALACGLPVVALDSGANSELVGTGGILFNSSDDLIPDLEEAVLHYATLQNDIEMFTLQKSAAQYVRVIKAAETKSPRKVSLFQYCKALSFFIVFLIRR